MPDTRPSTILGVKIDNVSKKEVLEKIKSFLLSGKNHYIVTLNPEMVIQTTGDALFCKIINEAGLSVADGTGIVLADLFLNREILPERIKGIDLIYDICKSDFIKGRKIFLLGAGKGIAEKAAVVLREEYPCLDIVGAEEGMYFQILNPKTKTQNEIQYSIPNKSVFGKLNILLIERINKAKPDILFVAFGAPKQEKWIYENIKKIPSVKLAIGVGGSFDFISGNVKRAPRLLRKLGLEWLWRLYVEPGRISRIYNATFKFCRLVLISKIKKRS